MKEGAGQRLIGFKYGVTAIIKIPSCSKFDVLLKRIFDQLRRESYLMFRFGNNFQLSSLDYKKKQMKRTEY